MKQIAKILIGSRAFFSSMPDFKPKDYDWLYIMDSLEPLGKTRLRASMNGNDMIIIPKMTKDEYINDAFNSDFHMSVGKFFVPEFAKYIGLSIEDLKRFGDYLNQIDQKHGYYKIIYQAYVENNDFILTDDQRYIAYQEYKKYRNG